MESRKEITIFKDDTVYMHDEFIFDCRGDAECILGHMEEVVNTYGFASVADLYDLVGYTPQYTDHSYGWTSMSTASVVRDRNGYVLRLPSIDYVPKGKTNVIKRSAKYPWHGNKESVIRSLENQPQTSKEEMVNHPPHYISETGLEVIDVIQAFTFDLTGIEATDTGNIIKYACRWKNKNGVEDLKKIVWYAQHLINHVEKLEKENA